MWCGNSGLFGRNSSSRHMVFLDGSRPLATIEYNEKSARQTIPAEIPVVRSAA